MSSQEQLNPYLNRFTTLVQQHATAKLEFSCSRGKVTVNIFMTWELLRKHFLQQLLSSLRMDKSGRKT